MKLPQTIPLSLIFVSLISIVLSENKYSRSANEKKPNDQIPDVNFRTLEKPFRMNKLNILWMKAQQRLTEPKLKSLYSELMILDKEELLHKRMKSEGGDKDGMKEAILRRKLTSIMTMYGLREHFEDSPTRQKEHDAYNSAIDDHINKSLFKDKKLNQLWSKAEASGFTSEELAALKEEFTHHQEKIDQYYDLLSDVEGGKKDEYKNALNEEELDKYNEISSQLETNEVSKDYLDKANLVRVKHRGLRDGFDKLHRVISKGPNNKEFIEPKVQGLWRLATAGNFTVDELASLKVELQHYESRLLKLRHLQADHVSNLEKHRSKPNDVRYWTLVRASGAGKPVLGSDIWHFENNVAAAGDKMDHFDDQQQMIKKHTRKVQKMHEDLEGRIMARHNEL